MKKTFDVMIITNTKRKVKIKRDDFMPPRVTENENVNRSAQDKADFQHSLQRLITLGITWPL